MIPSTLTEIDNCINLIRDGYKAKYDFVILDIEIFIDENQVPILSGKILTHKQHDEVISAIKKVYTGNLNDKIIILEEQENADRYTLSEKVSFINVWTSPAKKKLSTQISFANLPFRFLYEYNDMILVKLSDDTLGWITSSDFTKCSHFDSDIFFYRSPLLLSNDVNNMVFKVWETAETVLGIPYKIGGASKEYGFDCSSLTQYSYYLACNLLLPRHSTDQLKAGIRIALEDKILGDLLFLRNIKNNYSHVGIIGGFENNEVINASLEYGKVLREPFDQIINKYNILGVRRYILEKQ